MTGAAADRAPTCFSPARCSGGRGWNGWSRPDGSKTNCPARHSASP